MAGRPREGDTAGGKRGKRKRVARTPVEGGPAGGRPLVCMRNSTRSQLTAAAQVPACRHVKASGNAVSLSFSRFVDRVIAFVSSDLGWQNGTGVAVTSLHTGRVLWYLVPLLVSEI